jgi:CRISPR-associated protein Csb1
MIMSIPFNELTTSPRILIEAPLRPVAGTRIQPTGFPDLGPAVYDVPSSDGGTIQTLLVESAQSMANRLEAVCWDEATDDIAAELKGLPFVRVTVNGLNSTADTTNSLLEFHRLNSPYIMNAVTKDRASFRDALKRDLGLAAVAAPAPPRPAGGRRAAAAAPAPSEPEEGGDRERQDVAGVVNLRKLAAVCFKYYPNSLVHGVFLEKIAGRLRHPRALSAFIEASGVGRADSGGVKFDRVVPMKIPGLEAKDGYTNVPFHRAEFTAQSITAFFSLDLAQLRGYGLKDEAWKLLVALSLWKVRKFLDSSMRLRSACELELVDPGIHCRYRDKDRKDQTFALPSGTELGKELATWIGQCKPLFANPVVTELTWNKP